jgi:hypothetical protein
MVDYRGNRQPRSLRCLTLFLLALLLGHFFVEVIGVSPLELRDTRGETTLQPELPVKDWDGHAQSSQSLAVCSLCHFSVTLPAPLFSVALFLVALQWPGARLAYPLFAPLPLLPPPR